MSTFNFVKKENIDYILNFYRSKLYNEKTKTYIITTDSGEFIFLNFSAFYQLKRGRIEDKDLFEKFKNKSIIIDTTNFNSIIKKMQKRYNFLNSSPSLHIVIPTRRCNQGCNYCFATPDKITANKDDCDMDEKTAIATIEFIMKSKSYPITIEFTGGEALLRFDLVKLMTLYAKKLNKKYKKDLRITIVTNLTLMNDEIANWLIDNGVTICTSLDGPKEVHNKNRFILGLNKEKNIGSYDIVVNWITKINNLYKKKNIKLRVNALMTITKHSLKYFKEIIDIYVKYEMSIVDLRGMMSIGKGLEERREVGGERLDVSGEGCGERKEEGGNLQPQTSNHLSYSFEEFVEFYEKSIKYIDELKKRGVRIDDRMMLLYNQKVIENTPTYHTDYESPWGAAISSVTYYNNGDIYSCHEALGRDEFKLGDIFKSTWKTIFKTKETSFTILSSLLESNVICDRCVYKPYCSTVPIENYYSQGKFNFNPYKTQRHFETKFYCDKILNKKLKNLIF